MSNNQKKKPVFSKLNLLCFRLFAIIAISILIITTIKDILYNDLLSTSNFVNFFFNAQNLLAIILLFVVVIFPHKIGICSVISFLYSITIIFTEPSNVMGLFMFILGVSSCYARGYYNTHRKLKNIITIICFVFLNLTQIRFGSKIFVESLIQTIGFTFVFLLCVFFIKAAIWNDFQVNSSSKILNINNYKKLTPRDARWLIEIQQKVKYDTIALNEKMSVGSVKNRLSFVYSVLEVADKQGFLTEYSQFEIHYDDITTEMLKKAKFKQDGSIAERN